jgi:hypothetical protein
VRLKRVIGMRPPKEEGEIIGSSIGGDGGGVPEMEE